MKIPAAYVIDDENNNKKDMWQEENYIQLPIPEYDSRRQIELTQSIEPPSTMIVIDL